MTKDPPENKTAGQTDIWHGGEVGSSSKSLHSNNTGEAGGAMLRGYVLDAQLVMVEARFG